MKLTPASRAFATMRDDVASSVGQRTRPALLVLAVLSGLAVVVRLRRRPTQT
jgi:hypothetical protein